MTALQPIKNVL